MTSTMSNYTLEENFTYVDDTIDLSSEDIGDNQTNYELIDYCKDHIKIIREYDPYYATGLYYIVLILWLSNQKILNAFDYI